MHSEASTASPAPAEGQDSAPPCEQCKQPFLRKRRWQRFCGVPCRNEFHHRNAMPEVERIADLERRVKEIEHRVTVLDDPLAR
jgi:hypothetical protein